ncbi:MAG TPA: acetylxylan esterase, partial [Lactobacillus sp.]|nr:acetylxylan esterase [Lactobacillus sp.]
HLILPEYGHEDMHVGVNDQVFNWLFETQIAD